MSASLEILRERGPMTLRDLTRATASRMGWTLLYDDVEAVMRSHQAKREATVETTAGDWRDYVWSPAPTGEAEPHGQHTDAP